MTSRVDAHRHFGETFTVDDLVPDATAAGVGATVLVQDTARAEDTPAILRAAADNDLVAAVTGWVDLTAASVADDLVRVASGIGGAYLRAVHHPVHDEPDPDWLCRADVRRGLRAVADADLGYELLVKPRQLPATLRVVAELDAVEFVLDHCANPSVGDGVLEPWASQIRQLAGHENITCKLSGLAGWSPATLRPYVEVVIEAFGPQRLMFGSGWPLCLLAGSYGQWVATVDELIAQLSVGERAAITGGTARRFYGIPERLSSP